MVHKMSYLIQWKFKEQQSQTCTANTSDFGKYGSAKLCRMTVEYQLRSFFNFAKKTGYQLDHQHLPLVSGFYELNGSV